jgi:hypothetical protein
MAAGEISWQIKLLLIFVSRITASISLHANLGLALLAHGESDLALEEIARESYEACRLIAEAMAYHNRGQAAVSDANILTRKIQ